MCTLFPVLFPAVPGGARPPPPPGSPPGFHWRMLAEACPCPRWLLRVPGGTGSGGRPTHRAIWSPDTTEGGLSCRREGWGGGAGSVRAWGPKPGGRLNGEEQSDNPGLSAVSRREAPGCGPGGGWGGTGCGRPHPCAGLRERSGAARDGESDPGRSACGHEGLRRRWPRLREGAKQVRRCPGQSHSCHQTRGEPALRARPVLGPARPLSLRSPVEGMRGREQMAVDTRPVAGAAPPGGRGKPQKCFRRKLLEARECGLAESAGTPCTHILRSPRLHGLEPAKTSGPQSPRLHRGYSDGAPRGHGDGRGRAGSWLFNMGTSNQRRK